MITGLGEDNAKEVLLDIDYYRLDFGLNPFKVNFNVNLILFNMLCNMSAIYRARKKS